MKKLLFLALALTFIQANAQKKSAWQRVETDKFAGLQRVRETSSTSDQQFFQLNKELLLQTLSNTPDKFSNQAGTQVTFPNGKGQMEQFVVWENSNFEPALQAQFPEIRAYSGRSITDGTATIHFSVSPNGVQTMVMRGNGGSEFIEAYTTDRSVYVLFKSGSRAKGTLPFTCSTEDLAINQDLLGRFEASRSNNQSYKTMRLALSCTGEYAVYHGGTVAGALAGMNATMTRCNGVFEKDLALHLNMIAGNNAVIYTNAATDPYSAAGTGAGGAWNTELQNTLTNVIGNAAYDIGHLFGASGGGGNAGCIGCVCVDDTPSTSDKNKGSGFTSPADNIPEGDTFDIDYVAHEMGHQLGANHTFSHATEGTGVNVEPGSGSTIMGYAGITDYNVQSNSDDYFTYRSILQIQTNLATKTCPVSTAITANTAPVVSSGGNWTIPKGTAFKLVGSATDAENDALTYTWEQNDTGNGTTTGANSIASPTKATGPNFRSISPVSTPVRFMPAFSSVLNGSLTTQWESVNNNARTYNFTLTARDGNPAGPQTNTASNVVTVSAVHGPFAVTSQNTTDLSWMQGTTQTVTWSVNNTNILTGSSNVNILLSTDGGQTFSTVLAANTPNDGTENITVPNVAAVNCRILIEPTGSIFYAVNSKAFAIGYTLTTACNTYSNTTPLTVPDGPAPNTPGTVVANTITVPDTGTISDVNISMNVTHTYPNDLVVVIEHPDDTQVPVWNRACGSNDNFNVTVSDGSPAYTCGANMTGTFAPSSPLSAFNGKAANGTWTLLTADFYNGDTGSINSWGITVCTQTATLAAQDFSLAEFSVYPNPNNGNFTVKFNSASSNPIAISVYDLRGRSIFEKQYGNTGLFSENIGLDRVEAGVYLVTVKDGDRSETRKIIID
ncbi:MAG TPA: zinc-dependent metalloprotease family protein [Flavobacterium sp.]